MCISTSIQEWLDKSSFSSGCRVASKGKFKSLNDFWGRKKRNGSSGFLESPYWSSVGSLILVARFSRDRRSGNKEVGGW